MKQLYYNGLIYATADEQPKSALLIENDKVLAIGDYEELQAIAGEKATPYDLEGKCVLPGFQDSHCHLLFTGMQQDNFDLTGVTSPEELIKRGREFIASRKIPKGQWIIGRGFNQNLFANPVLPDKTVADAISTEHPILLDRVCGHMGALNTLGLETLKISNEMVIPGGEISKGENNELTGIFYETALEYVKSQVPAPDGDKLYSIMKDACAWANSLGLTTVHSNDVTVKNMNLFLETVRSLEKNEELSVRIFEEIQATSLNDLDEFEKLSLRTGAGSDYFKIGNIKMFADGSLGAHSAYMIEDYADDAGNKGIRVHEDEAIKSMIAKADLMGMQVACHAIGDGAVLQCIEAMEAAQNTNQTGNLRHRIVHCQIADDTLLERMATANIAADIQPPFVATDWKVAEKAFGDRVFASYRWKTMLEKGIHLGGGSDSPVESLSPIWGIHCAVNRTDTEGLPLGGWHPDEKLSVAQAVDLYTKGTAYLSFEENTKGALLPGYLADFVVLSENIFEIAPETIKDLKIVMTVVGGKKVFTKK